MSSAVLCMAAVALAADVGWRRLPDGGMEYIIRIEPEMLDLLKSGEDVISDIPPSLRGARSWRITAGTDELPREGELVTGPDLAASPEPEGQPAEPETVTTARPLTSGEVPYESASPQVPGTLSPPPDSKPMDKFREQTAAFVKEDAAEQGPAPAEEGPTESKEREPAKPWLPLTLALAALFGSCGGMLYMGWIAWDYRRQYRALLERVIEAGDAQAAGDGA